jgi:hypothetical protein
MIRLLFRARGPTASANRFCTRPANTEGNTMKCRLLLLGIIAVLFPVPALSAAEVRGVVASVDLNRGELVLDKVPRVQRFTLAIDAKAEVAYGKSMVPIKDLPVGHRVRVEYEDRDGRHVVTAIHANGKPPAMPKPVLDGSTVSGKLRRVGLTDREIVVVGPGAKGPETETTIAVPESAKVLRDGKAIGLDDLKEGESVAVAAEKRDGRWSAKTVQAGMTTAVPEAAQKEASNAVPRLRMLLRIADEILKQMDSGK